MVFLDRILRVRTDLCKNRLWYQRVFPTDLFLPSYARVLRKDRYL